MPCQQAGSARIWGPALTRWFLREVVYDVGTGVWIGSELQSGSLSGALLWALMSFERHANPGQALATAAST